MVTLHPSGRNRFELHDDRLVIGRLDRLSAWRSRYRASADEGSWLIHRQSLFVPNLVISNWYSDRQIGVFNPAGRDAGTLLMDGAAHHVRLTAADGHAAPRRSRPQWMLDLATTGAPAGDRATVMQQPLLLLLTAVILLEHFGRAPLTIELASNQIHGR
ncbi:MAG TPA: hypothetical protein VMF29_06830 [Candidatus Edwardsbacteria bacterium]|nr:hypothetical protein [Candidatus Edwardsbacteria bacterium]